MQKYQEDIGSVGLRKTEKPSVGPERNPSENQDESLQSNCNSNTSVQLRNLDSLQTPHKETPYGTTETSPPTNGHLRQLMDISWKDHVSNFQVLERAGMPSVEETITTCQIRWTGHVYTYGEQQTTKGCLLWRTKRRLKKSWGTTTTLQRRVQETFEEH